MIPRVMYYICSHHPFSLFLLTVQSAGENTVFWWFEKHPEYSESWQIKNRTDNARDQGLYFKALEVMDLKYMLLTRSVFNLQPYVSRLDPLFFAELSQRALNFHLGCWNHNLTQADGYFRTRKQE